MNTLATQSTRSLRDFFGASPPWRRPLRLTVGSGILAAGALVLIQRLLGH